MELLICTGKTKAKAKFPLIETKLCQVIKSDKNLKNRILNNDHHKYKSDTLLNLEYIIEIKNYATFSRKGTELDGKSKENNQDISIILNDVCDVENYNIYGIMDGHGSNGHLVSNFVKEKVIEYFSDKKLYKKKRMLKSISFVEMENWGKYYEKLIHNNYEIIRNFYKTVNEELNNTKFDIHFSGCTCVLVFIIGKKIICSNVGDSRAILVKKKVSLNKGDLNDIKYDYIQLSYDHKPENKEERERIEKSGGEVAQEYFIEKQDEPAGPFRVWNKGCDYPGIAISRSLGDKIAELIGVISEPDILEFDIDDNCKYIIMGSDGLFDYLSNDDIMKIAGPHLLNNNLDKACFDVVDKAAKLFKEKEDRIDDITINIIIL
jgi:serine/threonine protein phosphatase PrpC